MVGQRFVFFVGQNYSFAILRPLQDAIWRQKGEVRWFFYGDEVNSAYSREDETQLHSVSELKQFAPDAIIVSENVVPDFFPGLKVAVFHGFNSGKRSDNKGHFRIRGCFDLYCTQGPSTTHKFKQLAEKHGYFNVIETGWPALDPLYHGTHRVSDSHLPTILLCSTFSRRLSCAPHLLESVKRLSQNGRWRWLVQFHPKMPDALVTAYKTIEGPNLTFVETDNVLPLLEAADVMVCDTSSVLLMFLLLNKPVVAFNNASGGEHLINIDNPDDLELAIEQALGRPPALMRSIENYCANLHPYSDGQSSERVLTAIDQVLAGQHPVTKNKPLNLLRNIKLRNKLTCWPWQ